VGFGQPAWILHVFAVQNVAVWLILAWLLLRWLPPGTLRTFLLWAACLLTSGTLSSVRYALLDGPSVAIVALAVICAENGRPWIAAGAVGLAGLARETNLLADAVLARFVNRSPRSWLLLAGCLIVSVLPLLLWLDYLRSIYLDEVFVGGAAAAVPWSGLVWKAREIVPALRRLDLGLDTLSSAAAIVAFVTQSAYVAWLAFQRSRMSPWLSIALAFAVLGALSPDAVWSGAPGSITRVTLPLAIGFNLAGRLAPWPVLVLGNLTVLPSVLWFVRGT
jgi:hypothetical protein